MLKHAHLNNEILKTSQVSHHPPMVAQFCESTDGSWRCWQEFTMRSKFKGKYLEVEPLGIAHLEFTKSGNHYTWRKVKTVVHNIVIGKLWIDQTGTRNQILANNLSVCHYLKISDYSFVLQFEKNTRSNFFSGIGLKYSIYVTSSSSISYCCNSE